MINGDEGSPIMKLFYGLAANTNADNFINWMRFLLYLGFAYLQMGETDKAIEALEKALELNPDIIQAMCNLANAYTRKVI
jgi:cytochrome c-type biogenesis protein CcmH/NrfG